MPQQGHNSTRRGIIIQFKRLYKNSASEDDAAFLGLLEHLLAGYEIDLEAAVLLAVSHRVVLNELIGVRHGV